ncbi:hypothetical protein HA397_28040, partial [Escherichia coli]|nr:hypothetical protein [Escherichia coli]
MDEKQLLDEIDACIDRIDELKVLIFPEPEYVDTKHLGELHNAFAKLSALSGYTAV